MIFHANALAGETVSFNTGNAGLMLGKIKGLKIEARFYKDEVGILKESNTELSLINDDMSKLNLNYKGIITDMESEAELFEDDMFLCEDRAEKWKGVSEKCGRDLVRARTVPWYLSKRLWIPLSFVVGVYTGASAK